MEDIQKAIAYASQNDEAIQALKDVTEAAGLLGAGYRGWYINRQSATADRDPWRKPAEVRLEEGYWGNLDHQMNLVADKEAG